MISAVSLCLKPGYHRFDRPMSGTVLGINSPPHWPAENMGEAPSSFAKGEACHKLKRYSKSLVRNKSTTRTATDDTTNGAMGARPTPAVPPLPRNPSYQLPVP